jgi:hypothetical protein
MVVARAEFVGCRPWHPLSSLSNLEQIKSIPFGVYYNTTRKLGQAIIGGID